MFFALSKIISFLFLPLSWIFIALIASMLWKKNRTRLLKTSIILLFFFTNPLIINVVSNLWEVPILLDKDIERYEVGVVLGGFSNFDTLTSRISFNQNADRFNQGLRLLELNVIDKMLICGGSGYILDPDIKESIYVEEYLHEINVPSNRLLFESDSRNTHENAVHAAKILHTSVANNTPVLLITSGYHMRRSLACFKKQGIRAIPYSTNSMRSKLEFSPDWFLPNSYALTHWNVLIHEWIGYTSYWFIGYT
jgi:uncharacterized SAM-binding protein YcdF (DUF218 family)